MTQGHSKASTQHEITRKQELLRSNGTLSEAGYARSLILDYRREAIRANRLRIKEWDYYLICGPKFAVALTIADLSYLGLDSISFIDFEKCRQITKTSSRFFPMCRTDLPESSAYGDAEHVSRNRFLSFKHEEAGRRCLRFRMQNFCNHREIEGQISLDNPPGDSIVIATPFEGDPVAFYYNQKINCMPASGYLKIGDESYTFDPDTAFGVLDWGRGVWTWRNTWFWGSASGLLNGEPFGFNIGCGFGDTSEATENMVFYKRRGHKLSQVTFNIHETNGKEQYLDRWLLTSDDGRFEMWLDPILDRAACTNLGVICSDQHQVFGKYTGRVVLDNGTVLNVKDFIGFAEKVYNRW